MAKKIIDLESITTLDSADELVVSDVSEEVTNKVTVSKLLDYVEDNFTSTLTGAVFACTSDISAMNSSTKPIVFDLTVNNDSDIDIESGGETITINKNGIYRVDLDCRVKLTGEETNIPVSCWITSYGTKIAGTATQGILKDSNDIINLHCYCIISVGNSDFQLGAQFIATTTCVSLDYVLINPPFPEYYAAKLTITKIGDQ